MPFWGLLTTLPLNSIYIGSVQADLSALVYRKNPMSVGTVKWFNSEKGYGFIQPDQAGGRDVFVHISAVERAGLQTLREGQKLNYEIERDRRTGKESAGQLSEA